MSTVPFDTLEFVKRLRDADMPVKQAKAQAEALRHMLAEQAKAQTETNTRAVEDLIWITKQKRHSYTLNTK